MEDNIAIVLIFGLPVIGVIFGVGSKIVGDVLRSQERRLELRLQAQQGQADQVNQQLAALRAEVAGLRDTSTQFDVSVEQAVQRLEERIARIETKRTPSTVQPAPEETQRAGLR